MNLKKCKDNLFFIASTINIIMYLVAEILSPVNLMDNNDLSILVTLLIIMIFTAFIGTLTGFKMIKSRLKESLTIKNLILIILFIVNIIILLKSIIMVVLVFFLNQS